MSNQSEEKRTYWDIATAIGLLLLVGTLGFLIGYRFDNAIKMIPEAVATGFGLATTLVLSAFAKRLIPDLMFNPPEGMTEQELKDLMQRPEVGWLLGKLEGIVFFAAFWVEAYVLAAGWLAFKLGAKWQTWQQINKIPDSIIKGDPKGDPVGNFRFRHAWGSSLLMRFLIGSLYNILCGLGGVVIGRVCLNLLAS